MADGHICEPPTRTEMISVPSMGLHNPTPVTTPEPFTFIAGDFSDLWRCPGCRVLWRVGLACGICDYYGKRPHGGSHTVGLAWRRARAWQRLAARLHRGVS